MSLIGFFNEVDPEVCGGKGKNLVLLFSAGFPIPPGFVVTYDAYNNYIELGEMSVQLSEVITSHYEQLVLDNGDAGVSVRSSASAEDSFAASFAGQYDSYLYISSASELLQKTCDCWKSLRSDRARLYRKKMNIPENDLKMAVVVQKMVEPRSAGVLFTASVYPGNKPAMVLESSWGCGEMVVSGQATPDCFIISTEDQLKVVERLLGKKEILMRGGASGPVIKSTTRELQSRFSLTDEEIFHLCRMGRQIERHFGCPQDIEWALDHDGNLFILQSRPITKPGN